MKKIIVLVSLVFAVFSSNAQGVSTFAGSTYGYVDAVGTLSKFSNPWGVCSDSGGNIYVADRMNHRIRKITPSGTVTTLAGSGVAGYLDGQGIAAKFNEPSGICCDPSGNIYVSDYFNGRIRKITPTGYVSTYAGSGATGGRDGIGSVAQFDGLQGICSDNAGNIYVADIWTSTIRKINSNQVVTTIAGTYLNSGSATQPLFLGGYADGVGAAAKFKNPQGICTDSQGNIYVADTGNGKIRKITQSGVVSTYFSTGANAICSDIFGNLYVSDGLTVKKISASAQLTIIAGSISGYRDGYGTSAYFQSPFGICINTLGELFVADAYNYRIRKIVNCNTSNTPIVTVTPSNTTICNGSSITFLASGASSYLWSNGNNSNSITVNPTIATTYTVSGTNTYGCQTSTSTQVTIQPITTPTFTQIAPICKAANLVMPTTSSNGIVGNWSPAPNNNATTTYTFTPSPGQCALSTTMTVSVLSTPTASISADGVVATSATITNGNAIPLQLNGTFNTVPNIQWTPAIAISSITVANPVVYPSATTTYTASFVNSNGCPQTTSFTVNVTPQPNIGNLSISSPNATIGLFDTITVKVQVTNATDLYSLYMKLKGNAAVNQYLDYLNSGATAGTLFGNNIISTPPTVTNGVPDFGMTKVGAVPGYSGSGLFYTFTFVPKNISIPAGTTFCFYLDDVSAFNSNGVTCGLTNLGQYCYTYTNQINVWPGDLNNDRTVALADLLPIGYFYNSTGPARSDAIIQWTARPATLWGYNRSSTNGDAYKVFADSNGDGVINNADQAAIGLNMNKVHTKMAATIQPYAPSQLTSAGGNLTITPSTTVVNSLMPQNITFTVSLSNTGGLSSLYGLSANLIFDENIFDLNTATVNYAGSIFGTPSTDCLVMNFAATNTVSVALTRFANTPINGQGLLFKVTLQTKTTLPNLTQTPVTAYVDASNNQAGETLVIQEAPTTNLTINNNLGINTIKQDEFIFYPNPANELVYLFMGANSTQNNDFKVKVFNMLGQMVEEIAIQNTTTELSTKNWGTAGVYFVEVTKSDNTVLMTKKVIVNRK
jgi:streptogramin lyase